MPHPFSRPMIAGLLAAALIGALAACQAGGSEDSSPDAPTTTQAPPSPTAAGPTDISSVGESADPAAVGEQVRAAMAALTSYRMEIVSQSQAADRVLVSETTIMVDLADPDQTKVRSISTNDGQTLEMMQIGDDIYTKLPGTDVWQHSTTDSSQIPAAGGAEQLFTQAQQVRLIGEEDLDGVPVTHYLLLDTGATIDVFVDADHRVVKSITTTEPSDPSAAGGAGMGRSTVEITWHDFDQPQDIAAPDPAEIAQS